MSPKILKLIRWGCRIWKPLLLKRAEHLSKHRMWGWTRDMYDINNRWELATNEHANINEGKRERPPPPLLTSTSTKSGRECKAGGRLVKNVWVSEIRCPLWSPLYGNATERMCRWSPMGNRIVKWPESTLMTGNNVILPRGSVDPSLPSPQECGHIVCLLAYNSHNWLDFPSNCYTRSVVAGCLRL